MWKKSNSHFLIMVLLLSASLGCSDNRQGELIEFVQFDIDSEDLNLGDLLEGQSISHQIRIRNNSPSEIRIYDFRRSCKCASVVPTEIVIPPQGSEILTIGINVNVLNATARKAGGMPFEVSILPMLESRRTLQRSNALTFRGIVKPLLFLHTTGDRSENLKGNSIDALSSHVELQSTKPLKSLRLTSRDSSAPLGVHQISETKFIASLPDVIENDSSFSLSDAYDAIAEPDDGKTLVIANFLDISTLRKSNIELTPSTLEFGFVSIDKKHQAQVDIQSSSGSDFEVTLATELDDKAKIKLRKVSQGHYLCDVELTTTLLGSKNFAISLVAVEPNGKRTLLRIPVHCFVIQSAKE
jgi:hypothetical protein